MNDAQEQEKRIREELEDAAYGDSTEVLSRTDLQSRLTKLEGYISKVERRIFKRERQIEREINIDEKSRELVQHGVRILGGEDQKVEI